MSAADFADWGTATAATPAVPIASVGGKVRPGDRTLTGARGKAILYDGLVLLIPSGVILGLMAALFPDQGFVSTAPGSLRVSAPGVLLLTAVWLSYFALFEALRGQTPGKRRMGLMVVSIDGGPAGVRAISARTILRLIDDLGFFLIGIVTMLLTGERRRRLGDLAGRTVVVRAETVPSVHPHPGLLAWIYPAVWVTTTMVVIFGFGLGAASGASNRAVSLVRSYEAARASRNAPLACSLLAHDQQRELVALVTNDYRHATAAQCPTYVLSNGGQSSMVSPALPQLINGPLLTRRTVLGGEAVYSPTYPYVNLFAINENGHTVLDGRGLTKLSFVYGCSQSAHGHASQCLCLYEWLRAQQINPGDVAVTRARLERALVVDGARCRVSTAGPA
jgi:uncharacterized RDD family membrane protein YckC